VGNVAEVDDSADRPALVEQHVVEVEVAVHYLRPQPRPAWQHAPLVAVEKPLDEGAPPFVADRAQPRPQACRLLEIPEELPVGGRMKEPSQREVESSLGRRVAVHSLIGEVRSADPPVQPLEEANEVSVDNRPVGSGAASGADRLERTRNRKLGIDARHVQDRLRLQVENARILAAVRDLQDASAPTLIVDQERLVSLAAKWRRRAGQAEQFGCDLRRLLRGEPRRR
jgi:hypothetical protein